jgi:hypothetical protein
MYEPLVEEKERKCTWAEKGKMEEEMREKERENWENIGYRNSV